MDFFKQRLMAFKYAFSGFRSVFAKESHFRLHVLALLIVLNAGFYFHLSTNEWLAVLICSTLVISLELVNSAIETLCDMVSLEKNNQIKYIKDAAAAAVLAAAIASLVVAFLVFWPKLR